MLRFSSAVCLVGLACAAHVGTPEENGEHALEGGAGASSCAADGPGCAAGSAAAPAAAGANDRGECPFIAVTRARGGVRAVAVDADVDAVSKFDPEAVEVRNGVMMLQHLDSTWSCLPKACDAERECHVREERDPGQMEHDDQTMSPTLPLNDEMMLYHDGAGVCSAMPRAAQWFCCGYPQVEEAGCSDFFPFAKEGAPAAVVVDGTGTPPPPTDATAAEFAHEVRNGVSVFRHEAGVSAGTWSCLPKACDVEQECFVRREARSVDSGQLGQHDDGDEMMMYHDGAGVCSAMPRSPSWFCCGYPPVEEAGCSSFFPAGFSALLSAAPLGGGRMAKALTPAEEAARDDAWQAEMMLERRDPVALTNANLLGATGLAPHNGWEADLRNATVPGYSYPGMEGEVPLVPRPRCFAGDEVCALLNMTEAEAAAAGAGVRYLGALLEVPHTEMTAERFWREHIVPQRPVLVRGATRGWPAFGKWTDAYLEATLGNQTITAERSMDESFGFEAPNWNQSVHMHKPPPKDPDAPPPTYTWSEFLGEYANTTPPYVYASQTLPVALAADVLTPPWLPCLHEHLNWPSMWFGGGPRNSLLHSDQYDNVYGVLAGVKEVLLVDPALSSFIYEDKYLSATGPVSSVVDIASPTPNYTAFPSLRHAAYWRANVSAGDTLYIPEFWWHHVYSHGRTIAVTHWFDPATKDSVYGTGQGPPSDYNSRKLRAFLAEFGRPWTCATKAGETVPLTEYAGCRYGQELQDQEDKAAADAADAADAARAAGQDDADGDAAAPPRIGLEERGGASCFEAPIRTDFMTGFVVNATERDAQRAALDSAAAAALETLEAFAWRPGIPLSPVEMDELVRRHDRATIERAARVMSVPCTDFACGLQPNRKLLGDALWWKNRRFLRRLADAAAAGPPATDGALAAQLAGFGLREAFRVLYDIREAFLASGTAVFGDDAPVAEEVEEQREEEVQEEEAGEAERGGGEDGGGLPKSNRGVEISGRGGGEGVSTGTPASVAVGVRLGADAAVARINRYLATLAAEGVREPDRALSLSEFRGM